MFSVFNNCCIKLSKHWKPSRKNINIKPFIDKCKWKGIDFPAGIKDWKHFEENNKEVAFNILYTQPNTKTINLGYKSEYNRKRKNQVVC